ncbi:alpha-glucosidase [Leptospira sp. 96542]|nr:alpha-glucosidase [Leptospira sp. 96542]
MLQTLEWWKQTTIYQIYPWSFADSNGDGIGDLKGIIQKLDYLSELGVETIWFSPFFKSPGEDFGYDISDYKSIDPRFGTMEDCKKLITAIHKRKMKIVLDMVMNHTSDKHFWFEESKKDKTNPKRDFYIWKQGNGCPPNNWKSMVGAPGWNLDKTTGEYYYTNFLSFQPDLNYRNPEVKKEMFSVLHFWLKMGIDGFRLDIFNSIFKDKDFKNNPLSFRFFPTPDNHDEAFFQKKTYNLNLPESFHFAKEVRKEISKYKHKPFLIGEVSGNDAVLKSFLGEKADGLNLVFQFELIHFEYKKEFFENLLLKNETDFPAPYQPVYVLGNHDQKRYMSRIGYDVNKAKVLSCFQILSRGVPVIYYGEEIGRREGKIPIHKGKDPIAKMNRFVPLFLSNLLGIYINRDNCRLPMLWENTAHAGFTKGEPWLPIGDYENDDTVEFQKKDPHSLFRHYQILLEIRKKKDSFRLGSLEVVEGKKGSILCFERTYKNKTCSVYLNFGEKTETVSLPQRFTEVFAFGDTKLDSKNPNSLYLGSNSGYIVERKR